MADDNKTQQPTATKKAASKLPKIVVLWTGVGSFAKGNVICSSIFGAERCTQLMNQGAIRLATEEESQLEQVDLDNVSKTPANELHRLNEIIKSKEAMIDQQEREIQKLRSLNETAAATAAITNNTELLKKVAESEKTISNLQMQLSEAHKKMADAKIPVNPQ
jgi:predicted RNase H-like nuclease (RuvC/YqgF family)